MKNKLINESIFQNPSFEDFEEKIQKDEELYNIYQEILEMNIDFSKEDYYFISTTSPDEDHIKIFKDKLTNVIQEYFQEVKDCKDDPGERSATLGKMKENGTGKIVIGLGIDAPTIIYEYLP